MKPIIDVLEAHAPVPRISVCVITYNQAPYVRQCLDSILAQDLDEPFEIVVGDDLSNDGTAQIIDEYVERYPDKVRSVSDGTNKGAGMNYLHTHARAVGELVAHLDGDDYMLPGKLRAQIEAMDRHPQCAMSVHEVRVFNDVQQKFTRTWFGKNTIPVCASGEAIVDLAYLADHFPFFCHSSKMYRKWAAEGLDRQPREMIDCHWHAHHASRGPILYLKRVLGVYRSGIGISRGTSRFAVPSPYLRRMFEDAIDYAASLGAPRDALARSEAATYLRWARSFAGAGMRAEFVHYVTKSRRLHRLGVMQWALASLARWPAAATGLTRARAHAVGVLRHAVEVLRVGGFRRAA